MILKNIFFNPLKEIIIWIEFFINLFPGQIGKIIRLIWFSLRTVRFLVIRIDTNCKFIKINNIIFGKGVGISRNCSFYADGGKIIIGDKTAFNENCHINASNGGIIKIGKKCPIGPNVVMRTSFHNFNNKEMYIQDQGHTSADIIIEDNCWIAANVTILGGVKISSGSVVGAGAVVTKDIPANSVAIGVPAKVVKNTF